jgi:hypothetical protein
MAATNSIHGMWSTRLAFILAASGSAVGLGNIWRFPYTAGEYGGGAFVLVYVLCVALIGVPIMMAEIMLGRRGRRSPINTMRALAQAEGPGAGVAAVGLDGDPGGFPDPFLLQRDRRLDHGLHLPGRKRDVHRDRRSGLGCDVFRIDRRRRASARLAYHLHGDGRARGRARRGRRAREVRADPDAGPLPPSGGDGRLRDAGRRFRRGGRLSLRARFRRVSGQGRRGDPERHGAGVFQPEPRDGRHHDLRVLSEAGLLDRAEHHDYRRTGHPGGPPGGVGDLSDRLRAWARPRQRSRLGLPDPADRLRRDAGRCLLRNPVFRALCSLRPGPRPSRSSSRWWPGWSRI